MTHTPTPPVTIRELLALAFWGNDDGMSIGESNQLADVVLWRFDVSPKDSQNALLAAAKAAHTYLLRDGTYMAAETAAILEAAIGLAEGQS